MSNKVKKVCMIVYARYPFDNRVRREAETLAREQDYEVIVLTLKENDRPRTYIIDNVIVKELNIKKYYGNNGFRYIYSYIKFLWLSFLTCTNYVLNRRINIFHVHNMPNFLVFSAILPRLIGKKVILDIHDSIPETFSSKFDNHKIYIYKMLCLEERISCVFANKLICVNHPQCDTLLGRGVPKDKVFVSLNVPDHRRFHNNNVEQNQGENNFASFRLVYHGTIAERLGIDLALFAVSRLVEIIPNLEFNLWGQGDFLKNCIEISDGLNIADRINFYGVVSLDKMPTVLKKMDIGIISNRKDSATELMLPVKMLEYIALGIPVVVPRLKCIEHYFSDDMVSYFEPESINSMASAILKLYKDKQLRKLQAQKAITFLDKYGWNHHHKDLIRFYRNL